MSASETVETLDVANPITPDLVHDAEQSRELARAIDDRLAAAHERWGQGRELTLVQLTSETLYWLQMASTALAEVARRVAYAYDVLPKVGWEQWLANDLKLGKRTGYNLLKIAHRLLADGQDHERVLRLGPSKVYELLANFDDEQIETLEQGGTVEDLDLDRFDDMSVREMKRSLRKLKEKSTTYLKRAQEAESAFEGQRKELREVVYGKVATDQVPTTIQQRWRHTELDLAARGLPPALELVHEQVVPVEHVTQGEGVTQAQDPEDALGLGLGGDVVVAQAEAVGLDGDVELEGRARGRRVRCLDPAQLRVEAVAGLGRGEGGQAQAALEDAEGHEQADEHRQQDVDELHQDTISVTESPSWRRMKVVSAIFFLASARTM